jgi:alanine dehydrogenase
MTGGAKRDGFVVARMLSDIVSWPGEKGNQRENKHCIQPGTYFGMLVMFDARDGMPAAFINDGFLQHMRVAGGAGLGVKYLARQDSHVVGMIGSGGMARTYLEAFAAVRKITKVKVYSPNRGNAELYAKEMSERFNIEVAPVDSAREAVKNVDIVSCCTSSIDPVFKTSWLEPGMHVTDVTWDETEPGFARAVDVAVKMGESTPHIENPPPGAFYAAHGFIGYVAGQPEEKAIIPRRSPREEILDMPILADIISGKVKGRTRDALLVSQSRCYGRSVCRGLRGGLQRSEEKEHRQADLHGMVHSVDPRLTSRSIRITSRKGAKGAKKGMENKENFSLRAWRSWRDDNEFGPIAREFRTLKICSGCDNFQVR